MTETDKPVALVIGATGGIGGAVADRLAASGWGVRALHRDPRAAAVRAGRPAVEWVTGDAMNEGDVVRAAEGASLIFHGANPPGYRNWANLALPMLNSTIAAATTRRARILFPGTVYNYGPDAFPRLREDAPQTPGTRKGAIRVAMEDALARSVDAGASVLIVRAGDYFGATGNGWLSSQGLLQAGRPISRVSYPGPPGLTHAWAYLPDVAETMVQLVEHGGLGGFESFHLQGHEVTGLALFEALQAASGRDLKLGRLPWLLFQALAPFNETFREILEIRYLWQAPVLLDNGRLVARLGAEPRTELVTALRATLRRMGALAEAPLPA
ncbi:NAD(P)H-binding protein [Phenylobacterium sp. LjRoot225]|uniref:NAD-dependent epimerase/dehydratase family protein n=1 Tax=Phenylobacterium sp. LjRoot225 TaxID=3342285 RepID=UPI003ECCC386